MTPLCQTRRRHISKDLDRNIYYSDFIRLIPSGYLRSRKKSQ